MLFPYTYVPHKMERMQEFIDFIFYEVWCKASARTTFSPDLFIGNPDLHEVMLVFQWGDTAGGDFFYSHVERIHGLFAVLPPLQIVQFQQWYQSNNDIEKACANDPAISLARYRDIAVLHEELNKQLAIFFKGLYCQQLLDLAILRQKIGDMDEHYLLFMGVNTSGKCPFCGMADMQGIYHTTREAYDHYLPKGLYPFNSINFRNLVPACHHCNSSYKTSKDPAFTPKDPARATQRRKAFYPYSNTQHRIELKVDLKRSDIDQLTPEDIELQFGPSALSEEINTWKDIYRIEGRYKAKYLSPDAKAWLEDVRILNRNFGIPQEAIVQTIAEQVEKDPFSNNNFLKISFLEGCKRRGILDDFNKC